MKYLTRNFGSKQPQAIGPEWPQIVKNPALVERPTKIADETQDFRFITIDVKTANAWQGSICQIGIAIVCGDGFIQAASFMVDPEMPYDDFNTNLHGISNGDTHYAMTFAEIFPRLELMLSGSPLFQHSPFDRLAIEAACKKARHPMPVLQWIDSVTVARKAWPEFIGNGDHGLANLTKELNLSFSHQDAGEDARAIAMVILAAEERSGMTFQELLKPRSTKPKFPQSIAIAGDAAGPLFGKIAVFTGRLTLDRAEAAQIAAKAGLTMKASITLKTDILIVGDQDLALSAGQAKSAKHRRAEELLANGHILTIIGETEFMTLVACQTG